MTNRRQAAQRTALRPFGLTHVQFVLLASLAWLDAGGPVTQRQQAAYAAADEMMASQVLRVLEQRGLVVRRRHPEDSRARALAVTDEGRELAGRAVVAVEACGADFFAPVGAARSELAAYLRALRRRL